jgi:hypothetical protein
MFVSAADRQDYLHGCLAARRDAELRGIDTLIDDFNHGPGPGA